jgi:hypothetical protein
MAKIGSPHPPGGPIVSPPRPQKPLTPPAVLPYRHPK